MANNSAIEWTGSTWNPVVGCSILSPGCKNCYAMDEAARQIRCSAALGRETHYAGTVEIVKGKAVWTGKLAMAPDHILLQPLRRKKPTVYFVNSMSDLFHESVPDEWIDKVFAVMALCPQHTFQVLTKRAKRMREYFDPTGCVNCGDGQMDGRCCDEPYVLEDGSGAAFRDAMIEGAAQKIFSQVDPGMGEPSEWLAVHMPLPNVWLGVSTERQQEYDERWPELADTPAAVRFISFEPALGPLNIQSMALVLDRPAKMFPDWVICGGESGPGARAMHPDWARSLRDQCAVVGVPFFFKQWGEWFPCAGEAQRAFPKALRSREDNHMPAWPDGTVGHGHKDRNGGFGYPLLRVGKKAAGRHLDGKLHDDMPQRADGRGRL